MFRAATPITGEHELETRLFSGYSYAMLTLKGVCKRYASVAAVDKVDLSVPSGRVYGIIGKSGAGKSTLLRVASLLERPDSGEVYYAGDRADTLTGLELLKKRRKMGMIFQNFNLFGSRSAWKNVAYPLEIAGWHTNEIRDRVEELLETVGIADKRRARLKELSGGQKQRVAIARALAVNPEILFCDEATSALDPQTTKAILNLIRELHDKLQFTVLLITHQMQVIREICDEVAVMDEGRIVECGTVEAVFSNPRTAAAREMVHA